MRLEWISNNNNKIHDKYIIIDTEEKAGKLSNLPGKMYCRAADEGPMICVDP